ncbi:MAG: hypothetical protein IT190_07310 [Microbacteriaceae bacterium]|jgi:hypothetical protein|nr:hypothetical protein [Microbacteriaceae bacterium]
MTVTKTPTFTYSAEPTHTSLPTLTMTLTPLPTLEPTQAKETLQQLLVKQEPCQSPCFWGITPNQTTTGEAQNIFNQLNIPLLDMNQNGEKDYYAVDFGFQNGLSVVVALRSQDGLIDSIRTGIGFANYKSLSSEREWSAFSPETILTQYGTPTYVEFYISSVPSDGSSPYTISYVMIMYYDLSNLVIEYDSKLIKDEKIIKVCPLLDKYDSVSIWLGHNAENVPTKRGVSLENSTSLSVEQFSTLMLQKSNTACFDLSRDAVLRMP